MASEEDLLALSYNQLRKAAKALGIPATGKKAELAKRIAAAGAGQSKAEEPAKAQPAAAADSDADDDDEAAPEGVSFAQAKEEAEQQEAVEAEAQEKSMTGKKRHRKAQIHPDDKVGAEASEASGQEEDEFGDDLAAAAALLEGDEDEDEDDSDAGGDEGPAAAAAGPRKRGRTEQHIAVESAASKPAHRAKQVGNVHIVFGEKEEKVEVGGGARQFVKQSMFRPDVPRTTVDRRHKRALGAAGSFAVQADGSYGAMPAAQREAERARAARASERALVSKRKGKLGKSSRSSTARVPGSLKRQQIATGAKPKALTVQRPGQGLDDDDDFL